MIETFIYQRKVHDAVAHSPHALENKVIELAKALPISKELARQATGGLQRTLTFACNSQCKLNTN